LKSLVQGVLVVGSKAGQKYTKYKRKSNIAKITCYFVTILYIVQLLLYYNKLQT